MSLGATSVPAGSLLVFNGYPNPDRVMAVDPATGAVIASLALDANHDLTPGSTTRPAGTCSSPQRPRNQLVEIDPATGALLASLRCRSTCRAGRASPSTPSRANLWLGGTSGSDLVEVDRAGVELRRIDLALQGVDQNEISGLAFASNGSLWVASTQGVVYNVSLA